MSPPGTWTAGDSVNWAASLPDYDADAGWVLEYTVRPTDGVSHIVTAKGGASGADFTVSLGSSQTADWTPGVAEWFAYVRNGDDRQTVGKGATRIYPDPEKDNISYAREQLRNVENAVEARLKNDVSERYTVAGQSHDKIPLNELLAARDYWRAEVRREVNRSRQLATGRKRQRTRRTLFR